MKCQPTKAFNALLLLMACVSLFTAVEASSVGLGRRLLIRAMPQGINTCRNTLQGPWFMTDDRGKVCPAKALDYSTGCCASGELHQCAMCNKVDSCCESFEHCVSCCMAPENKPEERRKETPRAPNNKDSGLWADTFEYCLAACRTHSRSTSHENAYIGARHHCFSKLGKPLLSPPLPPGALDGVTVVLSASGASCAAACEAKSLVCSQQHLHLLNSCDRLREVVNCEAGCEVEQHNAAYPVAVDQEAPKASRPALCLVGKEPAKSAFTCDANANYMRRLCSCTKADGQAASGESSSGAAQAATTSSPSSPSSAAPGQQADSSKAAAETASEYDGDAQEEAADGGDAAAGNDSSSSSSSSESASPDGSADDAQGARM